MINILNIFRRIFKRRQHERYYVRNGTFVIVSLAEKTVQVIDISMGGTAFIYEGPPEEFKLSGSLKLFPGEMRLQKMNFDTVSDIPAPGSIESSETTFRRRGVKFKWLGVLDKVELNKFIKEVGTFTV